MPENAKINTKKIKSTRNITPIRPPFVKRKNRFRGNTVKFNFLNVSVKVLLSSVLISPAASECLLLRVFGLIHHIPLMYNLRRP